MLSKKNTDEKLQAEAIYAENVIFQKSTAI